MGEQTDRSEITARCRICADNWPGVLPTALATFRPVPSPVWWQVQRLDRAPLGRQPWQVGVSGLGNRDYGLANERGVLTSPRIVPVTLTPGIREFRLKCRDCRRRRPAVISHRLADQAVRRGETSFLA